MTDAPERILAEDDGKWWIGGDVLRDLQKYTRADLAVEAEARAWNAAIDAAAKAYADGDEWDFFGSAYDAIRALKRETP